MSREWDWVEEIVLLKRSSWERRGRTWVKRVWLDQSVLVKVLERSNSDWEAKEKRAKKKNFPRDSDFLPLQEIEFYYLVSLNSWYRIFLPIFLVSQNSNVFLTLHAICCGVCLLKATWPSGALGHFPLAWTAQDRWRAGPKIWFGSH